MFEDNLELFLESSKTDQFRDGVWVLIACTHSSICLVAMLERYMRLAEIIGNPDRLLFRGMSLTKQGYHLMASGGISYTRVCELLLENLEAVGLDPK